MKSADKKTVEKYVGKKKTDFYRDSRFYHQPVKDIIVITQGDDDTEIKWHLNKAVSSNRRRYSRPVEVDYKIRFQTGNPNIFGVIDIPWKKVWYRANKRLDDESHLLAFVCSSLIQRGWNQLQIMEEVFKHFQEIEAIQDDS